jgi:2-polyprenyl-3-methyl-5-hydroxy-6-metoxy-1,4-benzoquinol methylase
MTLNPITLADGVFDPLHDRHVTYLLMAGWIAPIEEPLKLVVQVSPQTKRVECATRYQRMSAVRGIKGVWDTVQYETTLEALQQLLPRHYVKGEDWRERGIPAEEQAFCDEQGIQVHYVDTGERRSSTQLLQDWAHKTAVLGADALDVAAQAQVVVPFDAAAQGYNEYAYRVRIEGKHPDILAGLCRGRSVLDVGCGPGHLVRMLQESGVNACGIDPHVAPHPLRCFRVDIDEMVDKLYDILVCREVLEHLPVREVGPFLHHLFRVARERVYLTTRFTASPAHPFDLTTEFDADPSHITLLPQPFIRALCVTMGGTRDREWEHQLDWQHQGRVLVYRVCR